MKKVFSLFFLLACTGTVFAQTKLRVGTTSGEVKNVKIMKEFFSQALELQGMPTEIKKCSIQRYKNEAGKIYYMYQAETVTGSHKIGIIVFPKDRMLYLTNVSLEKGTVTCSGCINGCTPQTDSQLEYYCGDGCDNCTKVTGKITDWQTTPDPVKTFINYFHAND